MEIYYSNEKARKFRYSFEGDLNTHIVKGIEFLKDKSHGIGLPYSRALGGGLFELRIVDMVHVRFIYAFHHGAIWILHGFVKKTRAIADRDMEYARKEYKRLLRQV